MILFSNLLHAQVTGQAASRTAAALGSSMRFVSAKALENERVRDLPLPSLAALVFDPAWVCLTLGRWVRPSGVSCGVLTEQALLPTSQDWLERGQQLCVRAKT